MRLGTFGKWLPIWVCVRAARRGDELAPRAIYSDHFDPATRHRRGVRRLLERADAGLEPGTPFITSAQIDAEISLQIASLPWTRAGLNPAVNPFMHAPWGEPRGTFGPARPRSSCLRESTLAHASFSVAGDETRRLTACSCAARASPRWRAPGRGATNALHWSRLGDQSVCMVPSSVIEPVPTLR